MSLKYRISTDQRCGLLKKKLLEKNFVRIIETHSGLSALIAQRTQVQQNGEPIEFDGFWESSLTDSASKGNPDAEIVGISSRLNTIDEILSVTNKPLIVDGDTGGSATQFVYLVKELQRRGVSSVIIEDKVFPKRNSLDGSAVQTLEKSEIFAQKIQRGIEAKISDDFMIIARIESLISGVGLADAIHRAESYINAGVDGIMIHSKDEKPDDILAFANQFTKLCKKLGRRPFLVAVPTTYNLITDKELGDHGFNIVIHANHLLRAAHKAMVESAETILLNDRNFEAEALCTSVNDVFEEVGFNWIKEQDKKYLKEQRLSVIIPAAGKDLMFHTQPKSLIEINNKTVLAHQLESIRKSGLRNVVVVRGYNANQFKRKDITYVDNQQYVKTHSLYSLMCARQYMDDGFILVFSDILFHESILQNLIQCSGDIVLIVDSSYAYHKHEIDKRLDLVVGKKRPTSYYRTLQPSMMTEVQHIGKQIPKKDADYEFVGIAYFSKAGADALKKIYDDCFKKQKGIFHEAASFKQAGITDIVQELIDRGFTVNALEVFKGWIEIHTKDDVQMAKRLLSEKAASL